MTIISTSSDFKEFLPTLIPTLIIIVILIPFLLVLMKVIMKNADNIKPLITKRAKIIDRREEQGGIRFFCTYCVEMETGERLVLRNYDEKKIIMSSGDIGMLSYRGKTIVSFDPAPGE